MNLISEDYLMHHGVKGMKWGVRRYQKADGSLNRRGLKRQAQRDAYISRQKRSISANKREIDIVKKQQKMSDKKYLSQFKDQIKDEMDLGERSRKDAEKEVLKYNRAQDAKTVRINQYQIEKSKKAIQNIKSTPIDKMSVVEAKKRQDNIMRGASIAGAAAGIGLGVALGRTGFITTGSMIGAAMGLGASGYMVGLTTSYSKSTKHYKKKGIDTGL